MLKTSDAPNHALWEKPLSVREDQMLERNTTLLVRLGSLQVELHRALHTENPGRWIDCTTDSCRLTREVMAGNNRSVVNGPV
jgi:hypothetical protein